MKFTIFAFFTGIALAGHSVHGHYVFSKLIINKTVSKDFQYVRDVGSHNAGEIMWSKTFPIYGEMDLMVDSLVCGFEAWPLLNPDIETATVKAGDELGFEIADTTDGYGIFHEGPAQIFLSKLPSGISDLKDYDASGDFFKIHYKGPLDSKRWKTDGALSINFTIPLSTPPGKYIARIEHRFPSGNQGQSQWFVNCAHLEIVGAGGGEPGPFVRFPNGKFEKATDMSVWYHTGEGNSAFPLDTTNYPEPYPPVWSD